MTLVLHFGYGAAAGALFAFLARPMSVGRGLAFGLGLWIVMQMAFVPLTYGWIEFGLGHGLSLDVGLRAGAAPLLTERRSAGWGRATICAHHAEFDEADRLRVA